MDELMAAITILHGHGAGGVAIHSREMDEHGKLDQPLHLERGDWLQAYNDHQADPFTDMTATRPTDITELNPPA